MDGLTGEVYWWEPVDGCWSVRKVTDPRAMLHNEPIGEWVIDGIRPAPVDPPFTSIAWRVVHMTLGPWNWINNLEGARNVVRGGRTSFQDGDVVKRAEPDFQPEPTAAVELWDEVVQRFRTAVSSFDDIGLTTAVAFPWGRTMPASWIVSHVLRELLHHAAEVGCIRDLYRQTVGPNGSGHSLGTPDHP